MTTGEQAIGILGLLVAIWAAFTEWRIKDLTARLNLEKNKNEDLKTVAAVKSLPDADLDARVAKDLAPDVGTTPGLPGNGDHH